MSNETTETPGILAAVCPPGWRRDQISGQPVMPCVGKLLFPCDPEEIPGVAEITAQCRAAGIDLSPTDREGNLVYALLIEASCSKRRHSGECLGLLADKVLCASIDAICRRRGEVRIVRDGHGWRECE